MFQAEADAAESSNEWNCTGKNRPNYFLAVCFLKLLIGDVILCSAENL